MKKAKNDYEKMSINERVKLIEKIVIIHPLFQTIFNAITECHQRSKLMAEPQCFFITGESGAGKSTLIDYYASKYPRTSTREGTIIPVLTSEIFTPATPKGMASGLLFDIGDPLADRGTMIGQTMRLYTQIEECDVEIIIIDEFQNLIDEKSNHVLTESAKWLKEFINRTKLPVVLVGMPTSDKILAKNEQLKRRFSARRDLNPFKFKTEAEIMDFRKLLQMIDHELPFPKRSQLADPDTALRFYVASRGLISGVMKPISKGAELAMKKGQDRITVEDLAEAYEAISALDQQKGNPFNLSEEELQKKLNEKVEEKPEDESPKGKSNRITISKSMRSKILEALH
jgi:predicted AAA+ superfamily ATPase